MAASSIAGIARADTIACDQVATCTQAVPGAACSYQFSVAGSGPVQVTVRETSDSVTSAWRVTTGGGEPVAGCGDFSQDEAGDCELPAAGTYVIEVAAIDGTGSTRVHLQRLAAAAACDSTLLTCDVLGTASLIVDVDDDLFRFDAVDGELVRIATAGATGSLEPSWRLLDAQGEPSNACVAVGIGDSADCGPLAAGTYHVQVGSQAGFGSANVYLQRLTAASSCDGVLVTCDEPKSTSITSTVESDLLQFGLGGDAIVAVGVRTIGGSLQPAWRLLDVDGRPAAACGDFTTTEKRDCGPLPAATYRVEVVSASDTGTADVYVQVLTAAVACDVESIPCGLVLTREILPTIDSDLYGVVAVEGDVLHVDLNEISTTLMAKWRFLTSAGQPAPTCGTFTTAQTADCGPFAAGLYLLEVATATGPGTFKFSVTPLTRSCPSTTTTSSMPVQTFTTTTSTTATSTSAPTTSSTSTTSSTTQSTSTTTSSTTTTETTSSTVESSTTTTSSTTAVPSTVTTTSTLPVGACDPTTTSCDDGDVCTDDDCLGSQGCVSVPMVGFVGVSCNLDALGELVADASDRLTRRGATRLKRLVERARRLLARAAAADGAGKATRASASLRRIERTLRAVGREIGTAEHGGRLAGPVLEALKTRVARTVTVLAGLLEQRP
jgi:hypothetical protein